MGVGEVIMYVCNLHYFYLTFFWVNIKFSHKDGKFFLNRFWIFHGEGCYILPPICLSSHIFYALLSY